MAPLVSSRQPRTHHLDLSRGKLESHSAQVVAQPLLFARRRDRHNVLVDAPPQANLAGVDGVFLRELGEDFIGRATGGLGYGSLRAVGGESDAL